LKFYDKTILDNGIRVLTEKNNHVKSFSLGIWIDVGSRDENSVNNGISHFIEHCVFKGTHRRTARQIAISLEAYGGYLNAFTTKEHTCFYARALCAQVPKAFDVLSDLITSAAFNQKEIEKEKQVVIEELVTYEDTPEEHIPELLDTELYSPHPLGYPVIGTKKNLEKFTQKHLRNFIEEKYIPSRMIISAVGDVEHEKIVGLANNYFGSSKNRLNDFSRSKPKLNNRSKSLRMEKDINQVHICIGRKTYGVRSNNRTNLAAINTILGGGTSSRLFLNIREKYGFAYNVYSFLSSYLDSSTFGIYICTSPKNRDRSIDLIWNELNKLKNNVVSKSELKKVKEHIKGTISLGLESTSSKMIHLATSELYFNRVKSIDEIFSEVDSITSEGIQSLAQELFNRDSFATVTIEPKNSSSVN
jgi:predicted Zn-dependent peptidase